MSRYLEIACRNNHTCRALLQDNDWSVYWITNPYMYLILDFQSETTHVRSHIKPDTLLVYPETLSQLLLVNGDARDILIQELFREQSENYNR